MSVNKILYHLDKFLTKYGDKIANIIALVTVFGLSFFLCRSCNNSIQNYVPPKYNVTDEETHITYYNVSGVGDWFGVVSFEDSLGKEYRIKHSYSIKEISK